jgi:hypothetical protein
VLWNLRCLGYHLRLHADATTPVERRPLATEKRRQVGRILQVGGSDLATNARVRNAESWRWGGRPMLEESNCPLTVPGYQRHVAGVIVAPVISEVAVWARLSKPGYAECDRVIEPLQFLEPQPQRLPALFLVVIPDSHSRPPAPRDVVSVGHIGIDQSGLPRDRPCSQVGENRHRPTPPRARRLPAEFKEHRPTAPISEVAPLVRDQVHQFEAAAILSPGVR